MSNDSDWWVSLARDLRVTAKEVDAREEGRVLTAAEVSALDDLRHEAIHLANAIEVLLEEAQQGGDAPGKNPNKRDAS